MNRLKHLLEERGRMEGEVQAIATACEQQNRSRTVDEKLKYGTLKNQLSETNDEIVFLEEQSAAAQRGMKPVKRYNDPTSAKGAGHWEGDEPSDEDSEQRSFQIMKRVPEDRQSPISDYIKRHYDVSEHSLNVDPYAVIAAIGTGGKTSNRRVERALNEVRAISGGSSVLDTYLSSKVLESYLAKSHLAKAGMKTVLMDTQTSSIGRISSYPQFEWLGAGVTQTEKNIGFDNIQLKAKTLRSWTSATIEFLQDAINGPQLIRQAFSYAGGKAIDATGLMGSGVGEIPRGIYNFPGANVVDMGVNGAALTSFDPFIDMITAVLNDNGEPIDTIITSPTAWSAIQKLKESASGTNVYLERPNALKTMQILETTAISDTMTHGTATNSTVAIGGGYASLTLGIRLSFEVVFSPIKSDNASYGVLGIFRGDFAAEREQDFAILKGILPGPALTREGGPERQDIAKGGKK